MKDSLWRLTPPLFSDWYQQRVPRSRQFESFQAADAYCGEAGYQDAELVDVVVSKNMLLSASPPGHAAISSLDRLIALAVACAINQNPAARIIDFGGGAGSHYFTTRNIVQFPSQLRWHVVETSLMAERATPLADGNLCFSDNLSNAVESLGDVDLVIASGALHYCDRPLDVLSHLLETQCSRILVTRSLNSDGNFTAFFAQESLLSANGPGPLPSRFKDRTVRYPSHITPHLRFEQLLNNSYQAILADKSPATHLRLKAGTASFYSYYAARKTK